MGKNNLNGIYQCSECGSIGSVDDLFIEQVFAKGSYVCVDCLSPHDKERLRIHRVDRVPFIEMYAEQVSFAIVLILIVIALAVCTFLFI